MHSVTDILNILLKSVFVGFGFVIPILALIRTSNIKAIAVKDLFILTAVQAVRIAGIFYFLLAAKDAESSKHYDDVIYETADLWFHTLVMLHKLDLSSADVLQELERRFDLSGLVEKANRNK